MALNEHTSDFERPDYSVIIPAYNEELWLASTLQGLNAVMCTLPFRGEVIVTDNNSTDKTAEIARRYGAAIVFEPKNQISRARNAGARLAKGDHLIFLDADTQISIGLLKAALVYLEKGECGGGTTITFDRPVGRFSSGLLALWTAISTWRQWAAGSFIYCRRDAFEAVGGFSEHLYAGEELRLSFDLKKWGRKHRRAFRIITGQPVVTSARKLDRPFRVFLATLTCMLFPFLIYSKTLCWYWYKRE